MMNTGASPDQICGIIRKTNEAFPSSPVMSHNDQPPPTFGHSGLYELRFYELFQSPSELPSATWWLERQELAGIYAKLLAWTRLANAVRIVQAGFDETKIDGSASCLPYLFCHLY
jgi:hypothetical protein